MPPHKILYVIGSLNVGGAERHLAQVLTVLDRDQWQPEIFCLSAPGALAPRLRAQGIAVHAPPLPGRNDASLAYRVVRLVLAVATLCFFLIRHRPHIVHFFLPEAYVVGGLCALLTGIKVRVMSRRSLNCYQARRPLQGKLERFLHPRMTAGLGNSRRVVEQLEQEAFAPARLGLIYNGVDLRPFDTCRPRAETRTALGVPEDALVLVLVANLIPYKGHFDLVEALAQVAPHLPQPWRLLCVGRDDGIGTALRTQAAALGIAGNILWLGPRDDVPDLQCASDIGLLCSHEEGFSNAILEAMAAGLPMVVTDVGGNAEAVVDGVTGHVVPAHDPPALAEAILALATDAGRAEKGRAGRRRVEQCFSLPRCVADYQAFYRALLGGGLPGDMPELNRWKKDQYPATAGMCGGK